MAHIGRNDPCSCGSKKKFKKCCLSREITLPAQFKNTPNQSEKILVRTLTHELFQPVRLYYMVHNRAVLQTCLRDLKCMKYDEHLKDWVVEYAAEAAHIGLAVPPQKIPKAAQPLIIATLYIDHETTMLIDVRSIERAQKLIEFIHKHVPKNIAEITHTAIYNALITVPADGQNHTQDLDYDDIFNQKNITVIDPEKIMQDAEELGKKYSHKNARLQAILNKKLQDSKKPLPAVEKFPVYFYEEGIKRFATACQMRQMIAVQHYLGQPHYSFYDLTQDLLHQNRDMLPLA